MIVENENSDKKGCGIYLAGSVLAFIIAIAKGGNGIVALFFSWLYVVYAIIELIFG